MTHRLSRLIEALYNLAKGNQRRLVARFCFRCLERMEGGAYRSFTLRKLLARDYGVTVGCHSYGEVFIPGAFAPTVIVGKFVSIAKGVRIFTQNHPIGEMSTHPYFYDPAFKLVESSKLEAGETRIGHDVWLGQNAILLPSCKSVGTGAIIGAGALVTKDVPPYAIVGGNPAKVIKYRFEQQQIEALLKSRWWDKSLDELKNSDLPSSVIFKEGS